jgi:NADH-quinone oxidoreductase subunit N
VTIFLGIELMSIPIYVLAGFDRRNLRSNESSLKYFLMGSFASAILLYGMALLYGATGTMHLDAIRQAFDPKSPLAMIGLGMLLVGFAFKISSVPFHQWTPDVYEGAPTSVTAFMAATVKVAAFVALIRILVQAFSGAGAGLHHVLWVMAALTMILGNFMAVVQTSLKRLLAYSSIAHAGYLLVYVFMTLGAFGVLIALTSGGQDADRFDDLAGLARSRPGLAALLTLFVLSLAGIPGTGGFMAKFQIFLAAVHAGQIALAVLLALTSLVSIYYYLKMTVWMYMREPAARGPWRPLSTPEAMALAVCALAVVLLGILPNNAPHDWLHWLRAFDWARDSIAAIAMR